MVFAVVAQVLQMLEREPLNVQAPLSTLCCSISPMAKTYAQMSKVTPSLCCCGTSSLWQRPMLRFTGEMLKQAANDLTREMQMQQSGSGT